MFSRNSSRLTWRRRQKNSLLSNNDKATCAVAFFEKRKIMKKVLFVLAALAVFAGCKREDPVNGGSKGKFLTEFKVEIADATVSTKASMDPSSGKHVWEDGDQILVDNGKAKAIFSRTAGSTFTTSEKGFEATGSYTVLYPASVYDADRSSSDKLAVNIATSQSYDGDRVEGGVYYATCKEPAVSLQSTCATVMIPIDPAKGVVRSAVLRSSSVKMAGPAYISEGRLRFETTSGEKEINLTFTGTSATGSVYFTLPALVYMGGMEMVVTYADGSDERLSSDAVFNLKPGVISLMELMGAKPAFSGGQGSEDDPYLIANMDDFNSLNEFIADNSSYNDFASACYKVTSDLDLSSLSGFRGVASSSDHAFKGSFDGDGHTLKGLTINNTSSEASGLFGYLKGAKVCNFTLKDVKVNSDYVFSGSVAGKVENSVIENVKVNGEFRAYKSGITVDAEASTYAPVSSGNAGYNGGLVGLCCTSTVKNCSYEGTVTIYGKFSGGLIGVTYNSTVENCSVAKGSIVHIYYHYTGGLIGRAIGADNVIKGCSFEGNLASTGYCNGGIVGQLLGGKVTECVFGSYGYVGGDKYFVAGIVGSAQPKTAIEISKCASYGNVRGAYSVAGICGYGGPGSGATDKDLDLKVTGSLVIKECAMIGGSVTATSMNSSKYPIAAGIIAWTHGAINFTLKSCYSLPGLIRTTAGGNLNGVLCGISSYQNSTGGATFENCYSAYGLSDFEICGDIPASESLWYAAVAIRATQPTTMNNCYSLDAMRTYYSCGGVTASGCEQFTAAQMTDGTLLAKLQSTAGDVVWVAGANGYPTIQGLPADPNVKPASAKRVSVIGDSISTFKGIVPGGYSTHYPATDGTLTLCSETYWYRLIYDYLSSAELDTNIAFSGSTVTNTTAENYEKRYGTASNTWWHNSYTERFIACGGVGRPDIILIHGGTNDWSHNADPLAPGLAIRNDAANMYGGQRPSDAAMKAMYDVADAATTRQQIEALPDGTFCEAYIKLLCLIKERYPRCKVVCIIGDYLSQSIEQSTLDIADHYGAKCVNLFRVNGFNDLGGYSPSTLTGLGKPQPNMPKHDHTDLNSAGGCHPGSECMKFMAEKIYKELGAWLEE